MFAVDGIIKVVDVEGSVFVIHRFDDVILTFFTVRITFSNHKHRFPTVWRVIGIGGWMGSFDPFQAFAGRVSRCHYSCKEVEALENFGLHFL